MQRKMSRDDETKEKINKSLTSSCVVLVVSLVDDLNYFWFAKFHVSDHVVNQPGLTFYQLLGSA
jgi:hypothetical protein